MTITRMAPRKSYVYHRMYGQTIVLTGLLMQACMVLSPHAWPLMIDPDARLATAPGCKVVLER